MSPRYGIHQHEFKPVFQALSDKQLCGGQREKVASEVLGQLTATRLNLAESNLLDLSRNIEGVIQVNWFPELHDIESLAVYDEVTLREFNEQEPLLAHGRKRISAISSQQYLRGCLRRLISTCLDAGGLR